VNLSCKVHHDKKSDQNGSYDPMGSCSCSCFCSCYLNSCSILSLTKPTTTDLQEYNHHHHNTKQLLPPPCPHNNHTPKITSIRPNQTPYILLQNRKHQTPTANNKLFSTSNHLKQLVSLYSAPRFQ
jgi:hypothetical protein